MTLQAGQYLLHYRLDEQIGAGGMGVVWKATDTRLGRTVAIKTLPPGLSSDTTRRDRFAREAQAVSRLNHPHICTLHDLARHDDTDFIVMEHVEGQSLVDRLRSGPLSLDESLRFGIQIAEALHEAHRAGVIHRDLKPGNVMLSRRGVKLLDFGLAKLVTSPTRLGDETPTEALAGPVTTEGSILGTLQYMAPEQLEGREVDARADVYALGCVLYEMLTGVRPFDAASHAALISLVMTKQAPSVSQRRREVSALLDHLVARCLAKSPDDRWQSALDIARELEFAGASTPAPEVVASTPLPGPEPPAPDYTPDYRIEYFTSSDGLSVAAARGGSGPPLLVVPAMVDTIEMRLPVYLAAFPDREVIFYDRRGTGLSERGPGFREAEPYLQDAQAVVDGFELDGFDVLGTLMGTIEAASVAGRSGGRVRRLVLRLPLMGLDDWASIPPVSAALAAMEKDWHFFTEAMAQMVVGWGNPGSPEIANRFRTATTREELRSMFDAFVDLDLASVYRSIQAPTLLEHNPAYFFPDTYSRRIASLIPDCRMVIYKGETSRFLSDFSGTRAFLG